MLRRRFLHACGTAALGALVADRGLVAGSRTLATMRWALSGPFVESLPDRLRQLGVPGVSIAVGRPRDVPQTASAGRRDAEREDPVTPDTVFPCGSLSKPVLATIALKLHARGAFDLDRPLVEVLQGDLPVGDGAADITARHALQHTTGLRNWRFTREEALSMEVPPGVAWGYSGEGIVLVQRALEAVTGRGLEALALEHVFRPFGMRSSTFLWRRDLAERGATPFVPDTDRLYDYGVLFRWKTRALVEWAESRGRNPAELTLDEARAADADVAELASKLAGRSFPEPDPMPTFINPNAAGSLQSTATDYLRFLHGWLSDETLRRAAFSKPVAHPRGLRWGLGWGMEPAGDPGPFWHWGEGLGFRTLAYADPGADGSGEGLVVLTNGNEGMGIVEAVFVEATGARSPIFDAV